MAEERRIRISIVELPEMYGVATIKLVEQTHIRTAFATINGYSSNKFIASNGVIINTSAGSEYNQFNFEFRVSRDYNYLYKVPVSELGLVLAAIQEYNDTNGESKVADMPLNMKLIRTDHHTSFFRILFQRGRETYFTPYTDENGIIIKSAARPEFKRKDISRGSQPVFFVRGREMSNDLDIIFIPNSMVDKVLDAVANYNMIYASVGDVMGTRADVEQQSTPRVSTILGVSGTASSSTATYTSAYWTAGTTTA